MSERFIEKMKKEGIDVSFRKARAPGSPGVHYEELNPDTVILPKGTLFSVDGIPLPCDIVYESDVAVKMRDSTIIYADIYRPTGTEKVPAIVAWSHYGKKVNNVQHSLQRGDSQLFGVTSLVGPLVSGLEKFEGPDPAYWCNHGYAVINPDARGSYNSQGDIAYFGSQEGEDGHDLVEWIAARDWSNGKVGMAGNSWLAVTQWFIAADRPPHLAAIAPWDGYSDYYRDSYVEGGIPRIPFSEIFVAGAVGNNSVEDVTAMIRKYPLMNCYWEDKSAKIDRIEIPVYVAADFCSIFHSPGTIRSFQKVGSKYKWLRIHNTQEWFDQYSPEREEDLRRFFDRYLKGIQNGWEQTPKVRLSIYDPSNSDEVNRPENEFPLARTEYQKLYLNAEEGKLSYEPVPTESKKSYSADEGEALFTIRFDQERELTGYMKLHLWVEVIGSNDMDVFVAVQKLDSMGRRLGHNVFRPYMPSNMLSLRRWYFNSGPIGRLRVSRRKLDPAKSTESEPYLTQDKEEFLSPGQRVSIEIPIRPFSMLWRAGEQLRLSVAGYDQMGKIFLNVPKIPTSNKGEHVIYAGGKYDSFLLVPMIPK